MSEEQDGYTLADYLAILRRRIWYLILPTVILFVVALILALNLPAVFQSSATILIEQQQIPQDLVRTTVTSYADQRVQVISQRVMSTANLGKIIDTYDLYADERKRRTLPSIVASMREDVNLEMISAQVVDPRSGSPRKATIAFKLAYENESARIAQRVTNELVSLFLEENLRKRREAAQETSAFLSDEAERLSGQISSFEARIAEFKEAHGDSLPEMQPINVQLMQRVEDALSRNQLESRLVKQQIDALQNELARTSRWGEDLDRSSNRVMTPRERLLELEMQYVTAVSQLQEGHPDLQILARNIQALQQMTGTTSAIELTRELEQARQVLKDLESRYADDHPDLKSQQRKVAALAERLQVARRTDRARPENEEAPTNVVYQRLQDKLNASIEELTYLEENREQLEKELKDYEERLREGPKIEGDYRSLTRDYFNAVTKYREVKSKQLEAELAESLESDRLAERFVLIEPPIVPAEPYKPNRIAIILLGLVASVAGGLAAVVLREATDDCVHDAHGIARATGFPALASVPLIVSDSALSRRRKWIVAGGAAGLILISIGAATFHYVFQPLDVTYYRLLHKVGVTNR